MQSTAFRMVQAGSILDIQLYDSRPHSSGVYCPSAVTSGTSPLSLMHVAVGCSSEHAHSSLIRKSFSKPWQQRSDYVGGCCRVQGYPTIKSVVNGKLHDYQGDRSASALKNWGLSLIPNKVVTVNKPAQLSDFLQRCSSSNKSGKTSASWSLCVLLLTAKSDTAALYKSLSGQYAGKIAFGEARGSNKELSDRFKVDR